MKKYFVFLLLIVDLHAAQSVRLARAVRVARELRLSMWRASVVRPKFAEIPLPQPVPKNKSRVPANALIECPNCGDEKPADQMMQLSCGDVYCKACLADQIKDAIKSRDDKALHCMHHLDSLFTEQELRELAAFDRAIDLDVVLYLLAQKVAESIPGYRHCPTPDCPSVFIYEEVPGRRPMPYRCTACNHVYCP
ncbi:hypothetical protein KAZ82_02425, partial [Candidatus Babeliales bacterium]|nr:hypothetical protein [Candidatus Babeliales bacterium]